MEIVDTGMVAIFITVLLSFLGLAVAWGTLHEKVKNINEDTNLDRQQNRDDHKEILRRIDSIRSTLDGGHNA
jgi:hypothetical protein